ncbi:MAG: hypothetical protein ABI977_24060 [Acidobacteriota bacterium]
MFIEFAENTILNLFYGNAIRKRPVNFRIAAEELFGHLVQFGQIIEWDGKLPFVSEKGPAALRLEILAQVVRIGTGKQMNDFAPNFFRCILARMKNLLIPVSAKELLFAVSNTDQVSNTLPQSFRSHPASHGSSAVQYGDIYPFPFQIWIDVFPAVFESSFRNGVEIRFNGKCAGCECWRL